MNAQAFANALHGLMPSVESLKSDGFSDDFAQIVQKSYQLNRNEGSFEDHGNPILNLVDNYEVSNFEIGMIRMNNPDEVVEEREYILFGVFDAFPLAIHKNSGEIRELDWSDANHIVTACAENSEKFLEALIATEGANQKKLQDDSRIYNEASKIATIAGGEEYLTFYLNVLGYTG